VLERVSDAGTAGASRSPHRTVVHEMTTSKWIVGMDLRDTATGALQFARWLVTNTSAKDHHEIVPVHVLEESYLMQVLRHEHLATVEALAETAAADELARAGLRAVAAPVRIVRGMVAEDRLVAELDAEKADAIVIGRQAPSDERHFVRLGRVARRLVRRLPAPIVVVPPDLRAKTIGDGPILLAIDLADDDRSAAKFAVRLAASVGREVVVVHVVDVDVAGPRYLPATTVSQFLAQAGLDRGRDLEAWKAAHHLADAPSIIAQGDVVSRLVAIAQSENAPIIVCGSRGMSSLQRVVVASVASELSCWAGCAVAIVPPGWTGR
jgi:nucleotide-binding universal stress UspA family protein